jgi:hypothetical protein
MSSGVPVTSLFTKLPSLRIAQAMEINKKKNPHITGSNKDVQIWRAKTVLLLIRNPIRIDHSIIPPLEYNVNCTTAR